VNDEASFESAIDAACEARAAMTRLRSLRLVYADWLDERGRPDDARAQRWMSGFDRSPYFDPQTDTWEWWLFWEGCDTADAPRFCSRLPTPFIDELTGGSRHVEFKTRRQAERALAEALARVAEPPDCPYMRAKPKPRVKAPKRARRRRKADEP
jgi:uncharacterized protein (TIGR02996 family)